MDTRRHSPRFRAPSAGGIGSARLALGLACLAIISNPAAAQDGEQPAVVRGNAMTPNAGPQENFTGTVHVRQVVSPEVPGRASLGLVTFQPGARTNWHTHPAGQSLYVTQGCGWTQIEGGPVEQICAGDAAYVSAGERHWHGATDISPMTHLAISEALGGRNVDWAEPVNDSQYHGPGR